MKKYIQIVIFLGVFFLVVLVRSLRGDTKENQIVGNSTNSTSSQTASQSQPTVTYKAGTYTGSAVNFLYGNIQVQAVIANGKITDVIFLQYPNDNYTSISINTQAMPLLKSEALQVQNASVDIVTGASDSSQAFQKSLDVALKQAI